MQMTVFKQRDHNGICLCLAFDNGFHAKHHCMNQWTIFDRDGETFGYFDSFFGDPVTEYDSMILYFINNHPDTIGRTNAQMAS